MTTPTQGEHAQTELRLADEYAAAHAKWALEDLYGSSRSYTSEKLTERHAARAKLERALHAQVAALTPAQPAAPQGVAYAALADVDALAQEIRRVDGSHNLGAGALAEALMPFLRASNGQAPATQQAVGNSGFDHKTAADFLSGKTVSDEALRKFVAASRGAHDDRAALRAQMLSLRGELASREAEIALLKRSLLDAESVAPQPPTAQAAPAADPAYSEACSLATALFEKHYRQEPDYASGRVMWSLCDTTAGVISQIDNMVSGLARAPAAGAVAGPGWKLVPVEPTDDMLRAIRNQRSGGRVGAGDRADWAAWLAAAPTPAAQADGVLEDAARATLFTTPYQRGEMAGDGKPCNNDHDPDCRWPDCICRHREARFDAARKQGGKHDNH